MTGEGDPLNIETWLLIGGKGKPLKGEEKKRDQGNPWLA